MYLHIWCSHALCPFPSNAILDTSYLYELFKIRYRLVFKGMTPKYIKTCNQHSLSRRCNTVWSCAQIETFPRHFLILRIFHRISIDQEFLVCSAMLRIANFSTLASLCLYFFSNWDDWLARKSNVKVARIINRSVTNI